MPRRNQEAEDEAYAQALQDEYRKEFIRRQAERKERADVDGTQTTVGMSESNHTGTSNSNSNSNDNRNDSRSRSKSGTRKKKSKGKGKKSSKSNNKSRSRSNSEQRDSKSISQDGNVSSTNKGKRRRRRARSSSGADKAIVPPSVSVDGTGDWGSAYNTETQQQQRDLSNNLSDVIPLPPPPLFGSSVPSYETNNDQTNGDEEYARRLQANFQLEEEADRWRSEPARNQDQNSRWRSEPARNQYENTPSSHLPQPPVPLWTPQTQSGHSRFSDKDNYSTGSTQPSTDEDEAVARRIQQELADAEYAERIRNLEQEEAASREVVLSLERQQQQQLNQQQLQQQAPPKSFLRKWTPVAIWIAIAIAIPLLFIFDVFDTSDLPFLGELFQDDWRGGNVTWDTMNGTVVPRLGPDAFGWYTKTIGLKLDILNACNNEYQPFVQEAIANWENGSPIDSLTLFTTRIDYESECESVVGKMKICNGDYGPTQWRGLNEVTLNQRQNTIYSSSAQLNDHYLNWENDDQKLYTSCHELGHGFGLPHWDEDFFNRDLGNCMDYTQNPGKNSKPDKSNFLYLAQLYGGREVSTNREITQAEASTMVFEEGEDMTITKGEVNDDKNLVNLGRGMRRGSELGLENRRSLRARHPNESHNINAVAKSHQIDMDIPHSESRLKFDHTLPGPTEGRRILHADENSEIHIYDCDHFPGCIVRQHFLLVQE